MHIVVCVKEVPNPALPLEFDFKNNTVKSDEWNYILNRYDEVALEQALIIKEKFGGMVTVITLGPVRSEKILRDCLAQGADKAFRVDITGLSLPDSLTTAKLLSLVISQMAGDIILCGDQSTDRNCAETGSMLAELLGLPVVTSVVEMDINIKENRATVSKRLERGARVKIRCLLPALFTTDIMLNEPRYPTLPGRKKAAGSEIKEINIGDLLKDNGLPNIERQLTQVISITPPPPKKIFIPTGDLSPVERIRMLTQGVSTRKSVGNILEGTPEQLAQKVVTFLAEKRFLS
ncbi:MAG TPA: electron transfer flavoprotein subunit beta/FixA family protein [Dehalococcoidales bacterium]|nr:electron transfer flavoprotein subunit beta/FixA family protein [Dehalococcoidales bacterium]